MIQVGITGGIGSGKSLVCGILERLGVPVYPADQRARELMERDPGLAGEIAEIFGEQVYLAGGGLDRKLLADKVFGDKELLERLNAAVHPVVRRDYTEWVKKWNVPYVVEEAAILFESGAYRLMDLTVQVSAPRKVRIQRVVERDGVSPEEVEKRMSHQMEEEEKEKLADRVINNDGKEMLLPQVIRLHEDLLTRDT